MRVILFSNYRPVERHRCTVRAHLATYSYVPRGCASTGWNVLIRWSTSVRRQTHCKVRWLYPVDDATKHRYNISSQLNWLSSPPVY